MLTRAPRRRASRASRSASASASFTRTDHHVFQRYPLAEGLSRANHRLEIVLLLHGHDRESLRRRGRVERYRQPELLRPRANASRPGRMPTVDTVMCRAPMPNPPGSLRIVSAVSTAGQLSKGSPMPMKTTLVGASPGSQQDLADLAGDLEGRQVPPEAHPAGGAKGAAKRAAGLGGDAERAPASRGDEHRLDGLSVTQPPEIFPGAIDRLLDTSAWSLGRG